MLTGPNYCLQSTSLALLSLLFLAFLFTFVTLWLLLAHGCAVKVAADCIRLKKLCYSRWLRDSVAASVINSNPVLWLETPSLMYLLEIYAKNFNSRITLQLSCVNFCISGQPFDALLGVHWLISKYFNMNSNYFEPKLLSLHFTLVTSLWITFTLQSFVFKIVTFASLCSQLSSPFVPCLVFVIVTHKCNHAKLKRLPVEETAKVETLQTQKVRELWTSWSSVWSYTQTGVFCDWCTH